MTDLELIATYQKLLIIEYSDPNNQPNAIATIGMLAQEAIASQIVSQIGESFSLNAIYGESQAQGTQIDILGQFVGARRYLPGFLVTQYFSFGDTTDITLISYGFGDTTVSQPSDIFNSTDSTPANYRQSDGEMVSLINFLAARNNSLLSVADIDSILYASFGNAATMTDNNNMSITYAISGSYPGTLYKILQYLNDFPHPAGVAVAT